MKSIGILKETKKNEKRVIILPKDISIFTNEFEVLVEEGLALSLNIKDDEYIKYGAKVVTKEKVWKSDIILKYKDVLDDSDCHGDRKSDRKIGIGYGNLNISKDIVKNWL